MPQVWFTITRQAAAALRAASDPTKAFRDTGVPIEGQPNLVSVPFQQVTLDLLALYKHPGEDDSDAILRLCAQRAGRIH